MKEQYQIPNSRIVNCIGIQQIYVDMKIKGIKCSNGILMLQLIHFDKWTILIKYEAYQSFSYGLSGSASGTLTSFSQKKMRRCYKRRNAMTKIL